MTSTVWADLSVSRAVQYGVPFIDAGTLQPDVDAGASGTLINFSYVKNAATLAGSGVLNIGTLGDISGTDVLSLGAQGDSYMPVGSQVPATPGLIPGFNVSASRGTRAIPAIIIAGDLLGEHASYALITSGGANSYQKLAGITHYSQGINALYPGGEIRFGTRLDGGASYTDWLKLSNAGNLQLSGSFSPPLLGAAAGIFQAVSQIYVCTGVPANGNGANGDFALRSDGGVGSCVYQKRAGAWVATGA